MRSGPESGSGFSPGSSPPRGKSRRRRWLWGLGLGAGLLTGAYFLFQSLIVDAQLRPVIERELAKAVHSQVSIGSLRGGWMGNVLLRRVVLTIPGSPWETHLSVDRISVNVELFNLLFHRKPLEKCFESLSFYKPKILLVKPESTVGPSAPVTETSAAGTTEISIPLALLPVPKIYVSQGSFSIKAGKTPREMLSDLNFDASTKNGAVWGLVFHAHSPEAGSLGTLRFNGSLQLDSLKISGKVLLGKWPLDSIQPVVKELAGWELESGTIDAESPVVFRLGRGIWFDAKTDLAQVSLRSPAPTSITLSQISGRAFIRPTEINVPGEMRFHLGDTAWKASGLIPFDGRPIAVRTTTDQLFLGSVFSEILKLKNLKVDGNGTATLLATGPLTDPVMQGSAELGPSHVGKWQLDSLSVKAGYEGGNFKLDEAGGKLYGGEFQANGFMSLSGQMDAPVSLKAILKNIDAKKLAASLGISGMEGKGDVDTVVSGTLANPELSAKSQLTLTRTLRNNQVNYNVKINLQKAEQKTTLSAVIDQKARLEAELIEKSDRWDLRRFSFTTSRKSGKLTGQGTWPKEESQPIEVQVAGEGIALQDLPFFNDQFPEIKGAVGLNIKLAGTPKDPLTSVRFSAPEVNLPGMREPVPMDVQLVWEGDELQFKKCAFGEIFSASGMLGLSQGATSDLTMDSKGFPVNMIAGMTGWENPPQPFGGWFTGQAHLTGLLDNPIVEGNGKITKLQLGDWEADQVEALVSQDKDILRIKKIKITQGPHSLTAAGSWDRKTKPGVLNLRLTARDFQLGKGPYLTGDFLWQTKTGIVFPDDWDGTLDSESIALKDLRGNLYHFNDFSLSATSQDRVVRGKVNLGKFISGSAVFDWSSDPPTIEALLKIAPVPLEDSGDISQFLPASLKSTGTISGQLQLKKGTFGELPLAGTFAVTNGTIRSYKFDRLEFTNNGNKSKVALALSLLRGDAKYTLSGTLESPKAVWDQDSRITVNGPFQNEKLVNLLSLLGLDTEKHVVAGRVDGDLSLTGTLSDPSVGFSVTGENLQYDENRVPSAELHFTASHKGIVLGKNLINLTKGQINIENGDAQLDPADPTVVVFDLAGSTVNVPIAVMNLTSQVSLKGRLALEDKPDRPTFDGILSILQGTEGEQKPVPFDMAIEVHKKIVDFKPMLTDRAQLIGRVDISQHDKVVFQNIHLEHSRGIFSVDGTLDLDGTSHFVSDAKNIPIEAVGKWFMPNFPLSGTGNYHLIFDGTLDSPVFTTSLTVSDGKIGDLRFDLLDGQLKSRDSVLFLGSKEAPLTLSRKGLYSFNVWGKTPVAFTKNGWLKVHNQEMDINAEMDKGDFGLILLAGLAKKASGAMDFSAHVGGTVDNPVLTMDLDLNGCQMVPNLVAQSIDDISGRVKVRNNVLAVEDLNGRIGQGRVFISSPPIEESKMVLENFIPTYLDFRVQTIGDHGLLLSIPTIMRQGEWGEIYFYGSSPQEPMLIRGPLAEPVVSGTALLDTGHYTFPPVEAKDENGQKIEYRELAGVTFDLKLRSGKDTWYSNDFNGNYLELKVNPGCEIKLEGKDADRTPQEAGIKCYGEAGSKTGWLRYFGHEFKLEEASLFMSKGKPPTMQGHATDRFLNADVVSAGGTRKTDVDVWVDFKGTFGNIDFTFDSNPRFSTDPVVAQKILLSNIVFGRDLTGLSRDDIKAAYEQNAGQAISTAGLEALENIANAKITDALRPLAQKIGIGEVDFKQHVTSNLVGSGTDSSASTLGSPQTLLDSTGNTLSAGSVPLAQFIVRKPLNDKLSLTNTFGLTRDLTTDRAGIQEQFGIDYDINKNLQLNATTGQNDYGQNETKVAAGAHWTLPDIIGPKKGDTVKPKFERFDVTAIGVGKYQLIWVTDKVTKSEIRILDPDGNLVQDIPEKKDFDYRHQWVVENLKPNSDYLVQISVKDPNGNETVQEQKISQADE